MPLSKIPLLLSSTWGVFTTMTPPRLSSSPDGDSEHHPTPTGYEVVVAPWAPAILKVCGHNLSHFAVWAMTILEIIVILQPTFSPDLSPKYRCSSNLRLSPLFLSGIILILSGTLLRKACYSTLGDFFTFRLAIHPGHKLITSGPYSIIRHPSYTAALLVVAGLILCHALPTSGSWLVECSGLMERGIVTVAVAAAATMMLFGLKARMQKEDEMLRKEFGKQWEDWRDVVRYRLLPGVY